MRIIEWLRRNLFGSWANSLLTLVVLWLFYRVGGGALFWVLHRARWDVIIVNMRLFMVGGYPVEATWRLWLLVGLLACGLIWGMRLRTGQRTGQRAGLMGALFVMSLLLVSGSSWIPGLPPVSSTLWNGLLLTLLLSVGGIITSFPLGLLLALGRQSSLPAMRAVCIGYIELIRGVPLITILFMAQLLVPLFLPEGSRPSLVLRAWVGVSLFSAAYLAEIVRGGLQAVAPGQMEAARALGLKSWQAVGFILLPQALRAVIPAMVSQFISLLKDTSLVAIVNLSDLMGVAHSTLAQPAFLNRQLEVYLFVALVYFVFSYSLSIASQRLEKALQVGER